MPNTMRSFLVVCMSTLFLCSFNVAFVEAKEWRCNLSTCVGKGDTKSPTFLFIRHDGIGSKPPGGHVAKSWHSVNIQSLLPPGEPSPIGVKLGGNMIITHPAGQSSLCEIWIKFREGGWTGQSGYKSQTLTTSHTGGGSQGERTFTGEVVPVNNYEVEFWWEHNKGNGSNCPAGLINLSLEMFFRDTETLFPWLHAPPE